MRTGALLLSVTAGLLWSQDTPDFTGTWQLDTAKSQVNSGRSLTSATWQIKETGQAIEMKKSETEGGREQQFSFSCALGGKECSFKDHDGPATASFWYNGPVLVELKSKGHNDRVVKYRMKLSEDGKTLNVEVRSVVPESKVDNLVFTKQI